MDREMKFIDEFCHKYQAEVGQSRRMWRRPQSVPYDVWLKDPDVFKSIECVDDVPMVEITMPEDRFRALMEHDHWLELQQRRDQTGLVTNAVRVAREHERECRIRHEHPSVRSAWEQYQIMLSMVDTGS